MTHGSPARQDVHAAKIFKTKKCQRQTDRDRDTGVGGLS